MYLETKSMLSLYCNKKYLGESPFMLRFKLTKMFNKQMGISIVAQNMF
jgi:hypothetical protein